MTWDSAKYPDNWNKLRRDALSRDDYSCSKCNATDEELHVHHTTPISKGGDHSLDNLKTLCRPCHEDIHGHPIPTAGGSKVSSPIAPPCPNGASSGYKCLSCNRKFRSLEGIDNHIKCHYCGHRVLLKRNRQVIKEIDVK